MKVTRRGFLAGSAASIAAGSSAGQSSGGSGELKLWYGHPAEKWTEALPIGNGRMGAMVFGVPGRERLQLNEDTLWSGSPHDWNNPDAKNHLPEVRRLVLKEGKYAEADRVCQKMQGPFNESYLPLADVHLAVEGSAGAANYRRELDLRTAVASVRYTSGGVEFAREVFASAPDQVIAMRLTAARPGALSFTVSAASLLRATTQPAGANALRLAGKAPSHVVPSYLKHEKPVVYDDAPGKGMRFGLEARVIARGGRTTADASGVRVEGADSAVVLMAAATGFRGFNRMPDGSAEEIAAKCATTLDRAAALPWEKLRSRHVADYARLFARVEIDLGDAAGSGALPTGERVRRAAERDDPALAALHFQFGRYLLISSSRPGTQPANLQGIWNDQVRPPWSSNYTININTQMNYWPAETANLAECHQPLFDMLEELAQNGRRTAEVNYGLPGWVAHHNADLWRQSAPVGDGSGDPVWANWYMAAPWLCQHLWEHWAFSGDREFLRRRAYPVMKSAAEFLLGWLFEDEQGRLVTCPSTSPENKFTAPDGSRAAVSAASTADMAMTWDLFTNCIEAAGSLGIDDEFRARLLAARAKLFPYQVGKHGQLQEWYRDFDEPEIGHRHISHLYGVHPGRQITPRSTPELAKAARVSLERRLSAGGGHTGWSRAWLINQWARLGDAERAHESVRLLLAKSTLPNLFDTHPPFQIDGNFGATAGIAEMLLQSHDGEIVLLPALPAAWPEGEVRGLRARGGVTVGLEWKGGQLERAVLKADGAGERKIRYAGKVQSVRLRRGVEQVVRFS